VCTDCTELIIDNVRLYTLEELSNGVPPCSSSADGPSEKSGFAIYPNPFISTLQVATILQQSVTFILYNSLSKKVLEQEVTGAATINTDELPGGIYFYAIRDKNGVLQVGKLVKE
jgi:hypothetical protein